MSENDKHFDIAKAGSLPPQHTSRPVITGRNSIVRDPMTVDEKDQSKDALLEKGHQKLSFKPAVDMPEEPAAEKKDVASSSKTEPGAPPTAVQETKVDDSITDSNIPPPPNKVPDSPAQKLIQEKKYHLPIHAHGSQSKISIVLYTLFVLAVIAGAVYVIIV